VTSSPDSAEPRQRPHRATRIATVLSFPVTHPGGISTFVRGMLDALERGYRVESRLISPPAFTAGPKQTRQQLVLAIRHLLARARIRPQVVVNHEHAALLIAAVAYKLLLAPKARVVHTVHIQPVEALPWPKRLLMGWLFGRCDVVTAVSGYTAKAVG